MTRRLAWSNLRPSLWQRVEPGDRLWVREAWRASVTWDYGAPHAIEEGERIAYEADGECAWGMRGKLRPGIFMPRWASRLTLTVTAKRIERLQEITEADALAEGTGEPSLRELGGDLVQAAWSERQVFERLWRRLHGADAWTANPEVCVISFSVAGRT